MTQERLEEVMLNLNPLQLAEIPREEYAAAIAAFKRVTERMKRVYDAKPLTDEQKDDFKQLHQLAIEGNVEAMDELGAYDDGEGFYWNPLWMMRAAYMGYADALWWVGSDNRYDDVFALDYLKLAAMKGCLGAQVEGSYMMDDGYFPPSKRTPELLDNHGTLHFPFTAYEDRLIYKYLSRTALELLTARRTLSSPHKHYTFEEQDKAVMFFKEGNFDEVCGIMKNVLVCDPDNIFRNISALEDSLMPFGHMPGLEKKIREFADHLRAHIYDNPIPTWPTLTQQGLL